MLLICTNRFLFSQTEDPFQGDCLILVRLLFGELVANSLEVLKSLNGCLQQMLQHSEQEENQPSEEDDDDIVPTAIGTLCPG